MPSKPVFIEKTEKSKNGVPVALMLGNKKNQKGEVGIEIEVEGKNLPHEDHMPSAWKYHVDHSLRGSENAEYVLASPLMFKEIPDALKDLWTVFKGKKSKLDDSNRTSVHIHLNCQNFYLNRLTSFAALYFIVEEILTEWCGEYRVGNLFCLRAKDAPAIVSSLKNFINSDGNSAIQEILHYSGFNPNALKKFGSIEIRTLRGTASPPVILDWITILQRLYDLSAEYSDPRDVCVSLSSLGPLAFFDSIMGPVAPIVRKGISMSDSQIAESVYEGVRIAQDLCFCREWNLYKPVQMKPDPFDRSLKSVAKKITNSGGWEVSYDPFSDALIHSQSYADMVNQSSQPGYAEATEEEDDYPEPEPEYDDSLEEESSGIEMEM